MEKEINKTNSSEGTASELYIKKKIISKLRFWGFAILFMVVFVAGFYSGFHVKQETVFGHTMKFMEQKKELTVDRFSSDPIDVRDFAWDSENLPKFITSDFKKAEMRDYDGVEYHFGENKLRVEKEFMRDELELIVNSDFGWSMNNFSIYSSGENIVIYGYWNDEFRRITVGKTEESVIKEVLTLNSGVPFSAHSKYITEDAKRDYIFVISEDMRTVSAYKDNARVGKDIVLPDEILGFYDGIMILAKANEYTNKLYMPYVIDNNGTAKFICIEVAIVTTDEVSNVSDSRYMDAFHCYTTDYSARMGYICCYIFENADGMMKMLVPNDIQKYSAYRRGTEVLTLDDDLDWHWIIINE